MTHAASRAWDSAKRTAGHLYDAATKVVHKVVKTAKHVVKVVAHVIADGYHKVKQAAEHVWNRVKQVASSTYHAVKLNRPGVSGDFKPWEGWSRGREHTQAVSG